MGTRYWRAPGTLRAMKDYRQFEYTAKADVYSFAMFRFEILSGEEPFEGHKGFDFLIVKSGIPP
jgi:serine/threonine protein kinase